MNSESARDPYARLELLRSLETCIPASFLDALRSAAGDASLYLIGGAVRDLLLRHHHEHPWRGLLDLDLVLEEGADEFVRLLPHALQHEFRFPIPVNVQEHRAFGTFELALDFPPSFGGTWLLDVASARKEFYPQPGENPLVRQGSIRDDLARRDFSVNALALNLKSGELLDFHQGQSDLGARELKLLHQHSLRDDPTRWVRGARYAARLRLHFSNEARQQAMTTLSQWPWRWRPGDKPTQVPSALGTRLRMELELLFTREPWLEALQVLQDAGGLGLLDNQLQQDRTWVRRLHWANRLDIPLLTSLVAGAADPLALAERLQLSYRQQKYLAQSLDLRARLDAVHHQPQPPSWWAEFLESPGISPNAVALQISMGGPCWRPLLRWWGRWRFVRSPISARSLIDEEGVLPGPELGYRLKALRFNALDHCSRHQ